jgi:ribosomal protein S18 acetylase RimI-like enzyme
MRKTENEIEHALEVFVRGFSSEKSRTHPYEYSRVGQLWWMRDAQRQNARDYRKEEWIAYRAGPREVDQAARRGTRGRFFVGALAVGDKSEIELRAEYKALGYRLLMTEGLFIHRLLRIPRARPSDVRIEVMKTVEMAEQFGKATRTRPVAIEPLLETSAPFRQYLALDGKELVGWVRSVNAGNSTWCSNLYVKPSHRRRGIARALMLRMLREDRTRGARQSVLLSSHAGALLYPQLGYGQLGVLLIFAPKKR